MSSSGIAHGYLEVSIGSLTHAYEQWEISYESANATIDKSIQKEIDEIELKWWQKLFRYTKEKAYYDQSDMCTRWWLRKTIIKQHGSELERQAWHIYEYQRDIIASVKRMISGSEMSKRAVVSDEIYGFVVKWGRVEYEDNQC